MTLNRLWRNPWASRGASLGIVLLGILVFGVVGLGMGQPKAEAVQVAGEPLSSLSPGVWLTEPGADPEDGSVAPAFSAADFDGNQVSVRPDGRSKLIYFLAHWCPFSRAEVSAISELLSQEALLKETDIYFISTGAKGAGADHSGRNWLAGEGSRVQGLRDDTESSLFKQFGGTHYPYAVFLDSDHAVNWRSAGHHGEDTIAWQWNLPA